MREACEAAGLSPGQRRAWARAFRRTALRTFDEGLGLALSVQGWAGDAPQPSEFSGPLSELSVADLVQAMALGRKDGVITVAHEGSESRLWCARGEIVDAESGALRGEPAVLRLLALERGHVSAELCDVQRERRVERPTPALLLEAAQRQDERQRRVASLADEREPALDDRRELALAGSLRPPAGAELRQARRRSVAYHAAGAAAFVSALALLAWRPKPAPPSGELAREAPLASVALRERPAPAPLSSARDARAGAPRPDDTAGPAPAQPPPVTPAAPPSPPPIARRRAEGDRSTGGAEARPDARATPAPRSPAERPPEPLVPRMRIIEERVPEMQIVE